MFSVTPRYLVITSIVLALLCAACSAEDSMSCTGDEDCFAGETCLQGVCRAEVNSPPLNQVANHANPDVGQTHRDVSHTSPDVIHGPADGDSTQPDAIEADTSHTEPPVCTLPLGQICPSNDLEGLNTDNGHRILPEGETHLGCHISSRPETFRGLDDVILSVNACPTKLDRFSLYYRRCHHTELYIDIFFSITEPLCADLDAYELIINSNGNRACGDPSPTTQCYVEMETETAERHFRVLLMESSHGYSGPDYTLIDVIPEGRTHFPYELRMSFYEHSSP